MRNTLTNYCTNMVKPEVVMSDPEISAIANLRNSIVIILTANCNADQQQTFGSLNAPLFYTPLPNLRPLSVPLILFHENRTNPHFRLITYSPRTLTLLEKHEFGTRIAPYPLSDTIFAASYRQTHPWVVPSLTQSL